MAVAIPWSFLADHLAYFYDLSMLPVRSETLSLK